MLAFQPELFAEQFALSPYADYRSGEAKAWKASTMRAPAPCR